MSNMKTANFIRIVLGTVGLSEADLTYRGLLVMDDDVQYPVATQVSDKPAVIVGCTEDIPDHIILDALSCLEDHMSNTDIAEWLEYDGDFCIDEDNKKWVDEFVGTYHGQDCLVYVRYLVETN